MNLNIKNINYKTIKVYNKGVFLFDSDIYKVPQGNTLIPLDITKYSNIYNNIKYNCITINTTGEYIINTTNTIVIYSLLEKNTKEIPHRTRTIYATDKNLIYFYNNYLYIYNLNSICNYNKYKLNIADINKIIVYNNRILIQSEDKILRVKYKNILNDKNNNIFEDNYNINDKLTVINNILIQPEPVKFISEEHKEVFTSWGLVIVYETGVEVYSYKEEKYSLQYIYIGKIEKTETKESIFPEERVFVKNGTKLIEILEKHPVIIMEVPEDSRIYITEERIVIHEDTLYSHPIPLINTDITSDITLFSNINNKSNSTIYSNIYHNLISINGIKNNLNKYKLINYNIFNDILLSQSEILIDKLLSNLHKNSITINIYIFNIYSIISNLYKLNLLNTDINNKNKEKNKILIENRNKLINKVKSIQDNLKTITIYRNSNIEEKLKTIRTLNTEPTDKDIAYLRLLKEQKAYLLRKAAEIYRKLEGRLG
ncbi:hypothetical protein NEOKW01_0117 [Nematocida sp. AWRm80]|nr:hypothetical protein NEOKW01_0117 [Nematocida sp. AWRm80]